MTLWDSLLLLGAILAAAASWRTPRAVLWIILAGADYAASVTYWRLGLPYGEGVGGMLDSCICLGLYFAAKDRWELGIYRLFQTSVAVNFLYLAGNLGIFYLIDARTYSAILEAISWLVLASIGGVGIAQLVGARLGYAHRPWRRLHRFILALFAPRATPHFLSKAAR